MNYKMIGRFLSQILMIESVFMVPALVISLCYGEMVTVNSFLLTLAIGLPLPVRFMLFAIVPDGSSVQEKAWSVWACPGSL